MMTLQNGKLHDNEEIHENIDNDGNYCYEDDLFHVQPRIRDLYKTGTELLSHLLHSPGHNYPWVIKGHI